MNRRTLLANLETALGTISDIKTVFRHYISLDITQYTEIELPLIAIKEPAEENDQEMTARRAMVSLDLSIRLYFVSWGIAPTTVAPTRTYETLIKKIRNKVGGDFTLNGGSTATWVIGVSVVDGDMPLYFVDIGLRSLYYQNQQAT